MEIKLKDLFLLTRNFNTCVFLPMYFCIKYLSLTLRNNTHIENVHCSYVHNIKIRYKNLKLYEI